jgi:propionyl-CoA carboxylase alpha chain
MKTGSFGKILIANRGEIALRVIRTCRALGIASVAVYSDADADAPHVRAADEAVRLGPAPVGESYLSAEKIIAAARRTGADVIHPGYGFLSENAEFAAACDAAGLKFIGPSAEVIRRMGLKAAARRMAAEAGVPVVPGYDGDGQSPAELRHQALEIGLPALIKASAGGGGKGMRVVRSEGELDAAVEGSRREAEKAFGDGALVIEKFIERARHVEFQIFGDAHGNLIHLFERECSVQRRHQKIIEETPSPALDEDLRERMGAAAIALGRALGYTNAGTVEFILTPSGEFFFIEVNTRLQVEHAVTEMTTGLDLVRLQIEIAEGRPLPFAQSDVRRRGHAIEARLYAEDPANDFLPATGTIHDWHVPELGEGLRVDAGIGRGAEVGIHYDPLLAKVIAHGETREAARRRLADALRRLSVQGVTTNREFLIRALEHWAFQAGETHTGFVGQHFNELLGAREEEARFDLEAAAVAALYLQRQPAAPLLAHLPPGYRNNPFRDQQVKLRVGASEYQVSWRWLGDNRYAVSCGEWRAEAQIFGCEAGGVRLALDGAQRAYRVTGVKEEAGETIYVHSAAFARAVARVPRYPERRAAAEAGSASAPMPGQVLKILVSVGERVAAGDALLVLEAMKMEQTIRAATGGVVEAVRVKVGEVVAPGDALVEVAARE